MIPNNLPIIAQLINTKEVGKLRTKGTVEKKIDRNTYVIRFSKGSITVKTETSPLRLGAEVLVKGDGHTVTLQPIEREPHLTDSLQLSPGKSETTPPKSTQDLISALIQLKESVSRPSNTSNLIENLHHLKSAIAQSEISKGQSSKLVEQVQKVLNELTQNSHRSMAKLPDHFDAKVTQIIQQILHSLNKSELGVTLSKKVTEGIYAFKSEQAARQWMQSPTQMTNHASPQPTIESTTTYVPVISDGKENLVGTILTKDHATLLLNSMIHSGNKSPLWNVISAEELLHLVSQKGDISFETINSIDKILNLYTSNTPQQPASTVNQKELTHQLINILLNHENLIDSVKSILPTDPAHSIPETLEQTQFQHILQEIGISTSSQELLAQSVIDKPKADALAQIFKIMGYNLEHELTHSSDKVPFAKTIQEPHDSTKALLLALFSLTQESSHPQSIKKSIDELVALLYKNIEIARLLINGQAISQESTNVKDLISKLIGNLDTLHIQLKGISTILSDASAHTSPSNAISKDLQFNFSSIQSLVDDLSTSATKNQHSLSLVSNLYNDIKNDVLQSTIQSLISTTEPILTKSQGIVNELSLLALQSKPNIFTGIGEQTITAIKEMLKPHIASISQSLSSVNEALINNFPKTIGTTLTQYSDTIYTSLVNLREALTESINSIDTTSLPSQTSTLLSKLFQDVSQVLAQQEMTLSKDMQSLPNALQASQLVSHNRELPSQMSKISQTVLQQLDTLLNQSPISNSVSLQQTHKDEAKSFIQNILNTLSQSIKSSSSLIFTLLESSQETISQKFSQNLTEISHFTSAVIKNLESDCQRVLQDLMQKVSQVQSNTQETSSKETLATLVRTISNECSNAINRLFDHAIKEILASLDKHTHEATLTIEQLRERIDHILGNLKRDTDQTFRALFRQLDPSQYRLEKSSMLSLPQNMQEQIEATLNRFESLQLLAKPTQTAEGQQQLLSLPMKFGDTWATVNLTFLKKRSKNKKEGKAKEFNVRMHVAPSQCGPIHVHMHYHKKHKLSIQLACDNDVTIGWFTKNLAAIKNTLQEKGIPFVELAINKSQDNHDTHNIMQSVRHKGSSQSNIDLSG